jgi:hypothetical protein
MVWLKTTACNSHLGDWYEKYLPQFTFVSKKDMTSETFRILWNTVTSHP